MSFEGDLQFIEIININGSVNLRKAHLLFLLGNFSEKSCIQVIPHKSDFHTTLKTDNNIWQITHLT